jgi:2-oxoglutarate dehydrogenase E1 component
MAVTTDTFLSGANAPYIAELYRRFVENPGSVDPSWVSFFAELAEDARVVLGDARGASWGSPPAADNGGEAAVIARQAAAPSAAPRPSPADSRAAIIDSVRALMLIRVYRVRGHLMARFDPLGLEGKKYHPELDPKTYGFNDADMDRPIFLDNVLGLETATLRHIVQVLRETYCGSIGVEFMHIQHPDEKAWIQQRIEGIRNQTQFTGTGKRAILQRLIEAEEFERFLHVKFTGTKRIGLDGGETTIPAIEQILKRASQLGVKEVVLGMAHRGRLNLLANIMNKPYVAIFS